MQQNKLRSAIGLVCLGVVFVLAGCTSQPANAQLQVLEKVEYTKDGFLRERYQYYLDKRGRVVLHGEREYWEAPGSMGTRYIYQHGKLVEKSRLGGSWLPVPNDERSEVDGKRGTSQSSQSPQ